MGAHWRYMDLHQLSISLSFENKLIGSYFGHRLEYLNHLRYDAMAGRLHAKASVDLNSG